IESENAQQTSSDVPMPADKIDIVLVPQLLRVRRFASDQSQARYAPTLLIDGDDRFRFAQIAQVIDQFAQLGCAFDVSSEKLELNQWTFVPAALCPFKKAACATGEARWSMLQAAIEGQDGFAADDCELKRPPPSYSIDTVLQIRERGPKSELFWLIGADNVSGLDKWHRSAELKKLVQFVVMNRPFRALKQAFPVLQRNISIPATELRTRVASCRPTRSRRTRAVTGLVRIYP